MADDGTSYQGGMAEAASLDTAAAEGPYRNFVAYEHAVSQNILLMRAMGEVLVGNPGIKAVLRYAEPQGLNPDILLLRLDLIQRPGIWPRMMTWVSANYFAALIKRGLYKQVQITNPQLGGLTVEVIPI